MRQIPSSLLKTITPKKWPSNPYKKLVILISCAAGYSIVFSICMSSGGLMMNSLSCTSRLAATFPRA